MSNTFFIEGLKRKILAQACANCINIPPEDLQSAGNAYVYF